MDLRIGKPSSERFAEARRRIREALYSERKATFGRLLERTGLAKPTLARHLKELRREGEVVKEESPEDARVVYYSLTPKGESSYMKGKVIRSLQTAPLGFVKEFKISSIPPVPLLEGLLAEERGDTALPATRGLLHEAFYEGLGKSASVTVLSEREFQPASIPVYVFAKMYVPVLLSLIEEKVRSGEKLQKQLECLLVKGYEALLSELAKGTPVEDVVERLTDIALDMERRWMEWVKGLFNFRFHIVVEYDGQVLCQAIDGYLEKLPVLRAEYRKCLAEWLKSALGKSRTSSS